MQPAGVPSRRTISEPGHVATSLRSARRCRAPVHDDGFVRDELRLDPVRRVALHDDHRVVRGMLDPLRTSGTQRACHYLLLAAGARTFSATEPAANGRGRAGRGNGQRTTLNDRARAGRSPSLRTWRCKVRARSCVSSVVSGSSGFDAAMPPRVGREASPKRGHASGGKVLRSAQSSRVPRPVQAARRCYSINGRGARSRQRPIVQPGHQVPLQSRGCSNRATKPARCGGSAAQHASCVCVSCLVLRRSTVLVSP